MYKRLRCFALSLVILMGAHTQAADITTNEAPSPAIPFLQIVDSTAQPLSAQEPAVTPIIALTEPEATPEPEPVQTVPGFLVDGQPVTTALDVRVINQVTYVSVRGLTLLLYPDASVSWDGAQAVVTAANLTLTAAPGSCYIAANGRYLYVPERVKLENGVVLVPVRTLAKALGAGVIWTAERGTNVVSGSAPIASGDSFYGADDLWYLSHIINCESGNQPLEGKIAVGNVILNRVRDARFPGTVKGVVLDNRGGVYQFTPANSAALNRTPNTESVLAAKLALDGAVVLPGALYFNAVRTSSWASRNRTYVTTIGGHNFYQ